MTPLASLALRIILHLAPLSGTYEVLPGWAETPWERGARYVSVATDVAEATEAACGPSGGCRAWALPALLAVAYHESAFAPDVDAGHCYRGRDGKSKRCDSGRAVTMWQLQGSSEERSLWVTDRQQAARTALRRMLRSIGACRALPKEERLAAYAGGRCEEPMAKRRARELYALVERARAVR